MSQRSAFSRLCLPSVKPRFSNAILLKGVEQRSQRVRHDKAYNLRNSSSLCPVPFFFCFSFGSLFASDCMTCRTALLKPITQTPLTDKVSIGKRCRRRFLMFPQMLGGQRSCCAREQIFIWMILWKCRKSKISALSADLRRRRIAICIYLLKCPTASLSYCKFMTQGSWWVFI